MSYRLSIQYAIRLYQIISPRALTIGVVSVGLLATLGLVIADHKITLDKEEQLAVANLYRVRTALEESFHKRLNLVFSLEALVHSYPDFDLDSPITDQQRLQSHFEPFARSLDHQVEGILSMQLAPDGIVTHLTNVDRNRQALGHDLLKDDTRRDQTLAAIRERTIVVAGPMTLKQGGQAIIARKAIFTQPGAYYPQNYIDQDRAQADTPWLQEIPSDFWGFATVLIDQETLFQEAGLHELSNQYRYALCGRHGLGEDGEVFLGDDAIFENPLTTVSVSLPNGEWIMGVQLVKRASWWRCVVIALSGISITIFLGYSLCARRKVECKLRHSNEKLIQATQLKDEFLANMSHELRTPLNAILGMTEGLQEKVFGTINEQQINALNTIECSGHHLLALIDDILDVAKIESGQMELAVVSTAVVPLCHSSLNFIQSQAQQKKIQIKTEFPAHLPLLLVDPRRVRQVLINLLSNAVKFTPVGGQITLSVQPPQASQQASADQYLQVAVSDTGIGISSEHIGKLFQPFIQVDSALNRQYQGTGLGLALTKRIVDLHGGQVNISSELGEGSCFSITLPCSKKPMVAAQTYSNPSSDLAILPTVSPTDNLKQLGRHLAPLILLAEDNEANIQTLSSYLSAKGYRIDLAKNGDEAIASARSHTPDLILMDIQMPGMDGLQATQEIRLTPSLQGIPIIALTALAMAGDRERCLAAGANDYLSKPVKLRQLAAMIQRFLAVQESIS